MKRRSLLLIGVALAIVAIFLLKLRTPRTPHGQPALVELERVGLADLTSAFNAAATRPRVLVMLSPT